MSDSTSQPAFDVRGAVDLAALNRPKAPPPGEPGGAPVASGFVVDATDETIGAAIQASTQYPVVVMLWIPTDQANAEVGTVLGGLAQEYAGRFQLVRVDAQAYPQVAAAFQVQGVPTVLAVLQGQPIPLFQGGAAPEQIRGVLDQVLQAAQANGVSGRAPGAVAEPEATDEQPEQEPALPPLHQEAYDAIERDDLDGAIEAYRKAVKQDRRDVLAVAGLAQVELLKRIRDLDAVEVRRAGAENPHDVAAQLAVADLDLAGGNAVDALDRLLDLVPELDAQAKDAVRLRLLDYFEIIGSGEPVVHKARQRLAVSLY